MAAITVRLPAAILFIPTGNILFYIPFAGIVKKVPTYPSISCRPLALLTTFQNLSRNGCYVNLVFTTLVSLFPLDHDFINN